MTEAIKQWIADEGERRAKHIFPNGTDFDISISSSHFISGLTKGIEIAEGFAKWAAWNYLLNDGPDDVWFDKKDGTPLTTSQLLEIYLKTLEP